jgi:hypothetical protein
MCNKCHNEKVVRTGGHHHRETWKAKEEHEQCEKEQAIVWKAKKIAVL